jgi:hypothetical protein
MEALRHCSGQTEREARVMGSILSFVPRKAATNHHKHPRGTPASIIIFPGVRYERRALMEAARGHLPSGSATSFRIRPAPRN